MSRYGAPFAPFRPASAREWVRFGIAAGGSALVPLVWLCRERLAGRLDWLDPKDWFPCSLLVAWLWGIPAMVTFGHFLRGVHEGHHDHAWAPRVFGRLQAITLALLLGLPVAYDVAASLPLGLDDAWWRNLFRRRWWFR